MPLAAPREQLQRRGQLVRPVQDHQRSIRRFRLSSHERPPGPGGLPVELELVPYDLWGIFEHGGRLFGQLNLLSVLSDERASERANERTKWRTDERNQLFCSARGQHRSTRHREPLELPESVALTAPELQIEDNLAKVAPMRVAQSVPHSTTVQLIMFHLANQQSARPLKGPSSLIFIRLRPHSRGLWIMDFGRLAAGGLVGMKVI